MDFLTIFARPPGELLYFVLVIALSFACLLMLVGQGARQNSDLRTRRYLTAFAAVCVTWTLLVAAAVLTLLLNLDARLIMPPLERAATVLTLVLLGWIYLSGDHHRWGGFPTFVAVLASLGVLAGYVYTTMQWNQLADVADFNTTPMNRVWTIAPLIISAVCALISVSFVRQIVDAPLKFVFFVLVAVGYGLTLVLLLQGQTDGDHAALVRLLMIPALAVSVVLVYRLITGSLHSATQPLEPVSVGAAAASSSGIVTRFVIVPDSMPEALPVTRSPMERESAQLLRALGMILEGSTPGSIPMKIISTILEIVHADVAALLKLQDANYADFTTTYDRMMKRSPSGMSLNLSNQPTLINAVERRTQRPLLPDRSGEELEDLYSRLDISEMGPAYYQPLVHDREIVAVLVVALPYTKRELTVQEEELLKGVGVISAGLLAVSYQSMDASMQAEERAIQAVVQGVPPAHVDRENVIAARYEMQQSLQLAREQIASLTDEVSSLKFELERERNRIASALSESQEGLSVSQKLIAVSVEQERLRLERDQLMARLQENEAALVGAGSADDDEALRQLVTSLQYEREELARERDHLVAQIEELRASDGGEMGMPEGMNVVLARMVDEQQRLARERDHYAQRLADIQQQLRAYGIEDSPTAFAQLVTKLTEERVVLQNKVNALAQQLGKGEAPPEKLQEYETRVKTLLGQLKHLAADREALTRQRDAFRKQRDEMNTKLETVKQHRTRLLAQVSALEQELKEAHEEQVKLRLDVQTLSDERSEIFHQLAQVVAEREAMGLERDQLMARLEGDSALAAAIGQAGIGQFQKMINEISVQRNQLQREVNDLTAKAAALENQLDAALVRAKATTIETSASAKVTPENAELMIGLAQEFRTPLTSMIGYVELLLNESAGILGDMQRKFLQRVSSNVKRLDGMIDDLVHITKLDTGSYTLNPVPLDVVTLIEGAVNEAEPQFREKGLSVTLNIEEPLRQPMADPEAVHQIVGQLLTNAYLAAPPDSEVSILIGQRKVIIARDVPKARPVDCIYVSIEDQGGGVMPEDVARVFMRKYRAENPLIGGLGDTGVGLSIAKALIEAHQGRIWVETREDAGTAFNFVLPLTLEPEGV